MIDSTMAAPRVKLWPWFLVGGLAVGTLDGLFASLWWLISRGISPVRVFQSVAAGLLGPESFQGGLKTACLGLGLHFFIATMMTLAYLVASQKLPSLIRHPVRNGALYGLFLYGFMNYVVIPLSAAARGKLNIPWVAASIFMHVIFGLVIAGIARRAAR
jgi:hypothetical protein